jgi:hypothetical protein
MAQWPVVAQWSGGWCRRCKYKTRQIAKRSFADSGASIDDSYCQLWSILCHGIRLAIGCDIRGAIGRPFPKPDGIEAPAL